MNDQFRKLNLPEYDAKVRTNALAFEIYDEFRRKWVKLTPEEWVRQNFLHYLTEHLNYPVGKIAVEFSVRYSRMIRRPDAVIYGESIQPLVIVECKAPDVNISTDVFMQALMYNKPLKANYFFLTNGLEHFVAYINKKNGKIQYLEAIPMYQNIVLSC